MGAAVAVEVPAAQARERLAEFVREVVSALPHVRQRENALVYVRGLIEQGGRKSLQPTLFRLEESPARYELVQQFLADSPWDPGVLVRACAERVAPEIGVLAWVVDDTGIAKQGKHSPGVKRQYSGTLGKIGNCQITVSVHAVGERGTPRAGRLAPWTPLSSLAGRVWLETYIFGMAGQERGEAQLGLPLVDHRLPSDVLNAHIAELCPSHEIEWQLGGRGRAEVRGPAGKRTLLIRTPPVRGQVSYFIALHEIGHLVGPPSGLSCEGRPSVPQSFSWPPKTAQPTGRNPIELSLSWIPRMAQTARSEGEPGRTVRAR